MHSSCRNLRKHKRYVHNLEVVVVDLEVVVVDLEVVVVVVEVVVGSNSNHSCNHRFARKYRNYH
jgi:hypothetical protein